MPLPKAIFFDMDNTLVDHEYASNQALLYVRSNCSELGRHDLASVRDSWRIDFARYWKDLINGKITLEKSWELRFQQVFDLLGEDAGDGILEKAVHEYGNKLMASIRAVPGSIEVLKLLKENGIRSVIITNNIERMVAGKLKQSCLENYIDFTLTSESCGIMKPDPEIFDIALKRAGTRPNEVVMVGDSFDQDVIGALKSGIPSVWFNRNGDGDSNQYTGVPVLTSYQPLAYAYETIISACRDGAGLKSTF